MTRGEIILKLLQSKQTPTYFAAQLRELIAWLRLGGIPSRGYQERQGFPPTPQVTDELDREKGLWDLVFCSIQDHGLSFHQTGRTPNPYGPILLVLDPGWLAGVGDVEVSLLSGGNLRFDRAKHGLPLERLGELFEDRYSGESLVVSRRTLQVRFGTELAISNPEISALLPEGKIPLDYVTRIQVDPYQLGDTNLMDQVRTGVDQHKLKCVINSRPVPDKSHFAELAAAVQNGCITSTDLVNYKWKHVELQRWANRLHTSDWAYQAERWASYLRDGTLNLMTKDSL